MNAEVSPLAEALALSRAQRLSLAALFAVAEGLKSRGVPEQAVELYKVWTAFNAESPLLHLALFNLSIALRDAGDAPGAINALRACLSLVPDFGAAQINLGRLFEDLGQKAAAIRQWQAFANALPQITGERSSQKIMALQQMGRVYENAELLEEAEMALWQAAELRPDQTEAIQHLISLRQRQCKWPVLPKSDHVSRSQFLAAMSPMSLALFCDDPLFQLARAYRYNRQLVGRLDADRILCPRVKRKTGTGARLRIGYVSSDLRDHAVGFALSDLLETHDKSRVEVFAYYCGEAVSGDATQQRIRAAVDHWRDLSAFADDAAAARIGEDEIDILVDVNGYTKGARTRIFAFRPAPVIVNWCGYPGTMGSPYHHYMIADARIAPPENEIYFSEKVLRIGCNQPVDRKRRIDPRTPTRAEVGLPENAFVYACFNGMQKVTAACFDRWMTILSATPDSVLWLLAGHEETNQRLRALAAQKGVAAERIVFAEKAPPPSHLARIALADLFLDTFPYGAHSTAADALTMGLPILSISGKGFAARFCGSVLAAAGIGDMVCATAEDYVRRAIFLGRNRESLVEARRRLKDNRETSVLRDIPALTRRLEDLFWQMQGECERGATPAPDLTNLDLYYEIGEALDPDHVASLDDVAYRRLYAKKLSEFSRQAPIAFDRRLWPVAVAQDAAVSLPVAV